MTSTRGFTDIKHFTVQFVQHQSDPKAHTHLNNIYSDALPNHSQLFVNPVDQDQLLDKDKLLPMLRQLITTQLILPHATLTSDTNVIAPIIQQATLHVECGSSGIRRLSMSSHTEALEHARNNKLTRIVIRLGLSHVYFDPQHKVNYLDWSTFPTVALVSQPPASSTAVAPLTTTDLAQALDRISPANIANAFAAAFPTPIASSNPTHSTPVQSSSPVVSIYSFNHKALPPDVLFRYKRQIEGKPILGVTAETPYASGKFYHLDGLDRLILSDGTLFIIQTPDEKGLMREPVTCMTDTYHGVRQWYQTFARHVRDHGYYAHPLWAFRKDKGGSWGFTCGNDSDNDVPGHMEISLRNMAHPIFRLLQKPNMFPANSYIQQILATSYGDGYKVLKGILLKIHPAFHDQPSTLITAYPRQKEASLLEYYQLFQDFLQLRAFINNIDASLDDANEVDVFINNSAHKQFLNRVTRDERRLVSNSHRYTGSQLVETLEKFLMAADSPLTKPAKLGNSFKSTKPSNIPAYNTNRNRYGSENQGRNRYTADTSNRQRYMANEVPTRAINQISASEDATEYTTVDCSDDTEQGLLDDVFALEIPSTNEDRKLFHIYTASINSIQNQPSKALSTPCIVCSGNHPFDNCNVLKDTDFLRQHYVRYCQHLRRESSARQKSFSGTEAEIPTGNLQVNFIHRSKSTRRESDSDDDQEDSDFQRGRL